MSTEPWTRHGWVPHSQLMLDSFRRWLGRDLVPRAGTPAEQARALWDAPFVVVSHGSAADPLLTYGNRAALALWETDADTLLATPSRLTAEPVHRDERARLLERTARDGYADDYAGVRVSTTGRRFRIADTIVWNLVGPADEYLGQAATFSNWRHLDG